ncbi:MAG: PQQ-binding-like beta-propeller repeat protein [candidate division WOR-3 bacterium]
MKVKKFLIFFFLLGIFVLFGENFQTHPWACYHYDSQRTGRSNFIVGDSLEIAWTYNVGAEISGSAVVDNLGRIIFGARDGYLYCLNSNGELLWRTSLGATVYFSTPALDDSGNIYVTTSRKLIKLNSNGEILWSWPTHNLLSISHSPVIGNDGKVYFACYSESLYALDPAGNLVWAFYLEGDVNSSPAIGRDGRIYIATTRASQNKLWAFNPFGSLAWSYNLLGEADFATPAVGYDSVIYISVGYSNYLLYAIKPDGSLKWQTNLASSGYSCPAIAYDSTVYINASGRLYCVDSRTGNIRWSLSGFSSYSAPAIDSLGNIYLGSDRNFYVVSPNGQILCSRSISSSQSFLSSPAIGPGNRVYFGHMNGIFYAFQGYPQVFIKEEKENKILSSLKALPNPCNFFTTIYYHLALSDNVVLKLYNNSGYLLKTYNQYLPAGNHKLKILVNNLVKGIYFLVLETSKEKGIIKLIVK